MSLRLGLQIKASISSAHKQERKPCASGGAGDCILRSCLARAGERRRTVAIKTGIRERVSSSVRCVQFNPTDAGQLVIGSIDNSVGLCEANGDDILRQVASLAQSAGERCRAVTGETDLLKNGSDCVRTVVCTLDGSFLASG